MHERRLSCIVLENNIFLLSLLFWWKQFFFSKNVNLTFIYRSSRSEVFCKNCALKIFAKFTEKHLCQSLFFNKVAGLVFSCEYCKIFKNSFFYRPPPVAASVSTGRRQVTESNSWDEWLAWRVRSDCTMHKKWSFPLRISSVNATKPAVLQWLHHSIVVLCKSNER